MPAPAVSNPVSAPDVIASAPGAAAPVGAASGVVIGGAMPAETAGLSVPSSGPAAESSGGAPTGAAAAGAIAGNPPAAAPPAPAPAAPAPAPAAPAPAERPAAAPSASPPAPAPAASPEAAPVAAPPNPAPAAPAAAPAPAPAAAAVPAPAAAAVPAAAAPAAPAAAAPPAAAAVPAAAVPPAAAPSAGTIAARNGIVRSSLRPVEIARVLRECRLGSRDPLVGLPVRLAGGFARVDLRLQLADPARQLILVLDGRSDRGQPDIRDVFGLRHEGEVAGPFGEPELFPRLQSLLSAASAREERPRSESSAGCSRTARVPAAARPRRVRPAREAIHH